MLNIKKILTKNTILLTCRLCIKYTLSGESVYRSGLCRLKTDTLTIEILNIHDTDNHRECIFYVGKEIYKLTSITPLRFTKVANIEAPGDNHLYNESVITHPFNIYGSLYGFCYKNNKKTRKSTTDYILSLFYNTSHGISPIYFNTSQEHMRLPVYLANGMDLIDFQLTSLLATISQHRFAIGLIVLFIILNFITYKKPNLVENISNLKLSYWILILIIMMSLILFFFDGNPEDFIYFRF